MSLADIIREKQERVEREKHEIKELLRKQKEVESIQEINIKKEVMYDVWRFFREKYPVELIADYILGPPLHYHNSKRVETLILKIESADYLLILDDTYDTFTTFEFIKGSSCHSGMPQIQMHRRPDSSFTDLILNINNRYDPNDTNVIDGTIKLWSHFAKTKRIPEYAHEVMKYIKCRHTGYKQNYSKCIDRYNARLILAKWKESKVLSCLNRDLVGIIVRIVARVEGELHIGPRPLDGSDP